MILNDPNLFRWLFILVLVSNLAVSASHRRKARAVETIPRAAESSGLRKLRLAMALPGLFFMLCFILGLPGLSWSYLPLPTWSRWLGVALGAASVPLSVWVLRSLGSNVSETVLTKKRHQLVTHGPYRWIRHPLYTVGLLMLAALSLISASWPLVVVTLGSAWIFGKVVIPREEQQLIEKFGERYEKYQRRTGGLLPLPWVAE